VRLLAGAYRVICKRASDSRFSGEAAARLAVGNVAAFQTVVLARPLGWG
jgi:hypothetical protein